MELYSQSVWILGWLSLHIQTKFQNKTKTKLHKFCATSYRYFSLAKFCQLRYIIKKQTWTRNVLWMNTNLKNITLRCGYSGMIFLKTLQVNLSDTCHITPRILFKGRNTKHFKDWQRFSSKETFLVYSTFINFAQRKKNVWCEWFISTYTQYCNSPYLKFYCTYLKTTTWDDIVL